MALQRQRIWRVLFACFAVIGHHSVLGQDILGRLGGEYLISGNVAGNQTYADLAFNQFGGYVIWQDDVSDGVGTGISAQKLGANLSGNLSPFSVNSVTAGHQEKPQLEMLSNGGAVAVWQGGEISEQDIFARILTPTGTFAGVEFQVNQHSDQFQIYPKLTILTDDTIVIVWESFGQDGDLRGVFGRMFNSDGTPQGNEFQINQTTSFNQRGPTIDALPGGGFVVAWISERSLGPDVNGGTKYTADLMVRKYSASGEPLGDELKVNNNNHFCATPDIVGLSGDSWVLAWSQKAVSDRASGWDIYSVGFMSDGIKLNAAAKINQHTYGDQHSPEIAARGTTLLVVWSSMGQDGSHDGIYSRTADTQGLAFGSETLINTSTFNRQIQPAVGVDHAGRFLVVWSSYVNGGSYFDLHAQRFSATATLPGIAAPFASALSPDSISLSWPELAGYDVMRYEIQVDGATNSINTTNNHVVVGSLAPGVAYSFQLRFTLGDGRQGALSPAVVESTWGLDGNFDGLPDDWQGGFWSFGSWPDRSEDSDGDGASNLEEFFAGTNPTDASSVLRLSIEKRGGNVWIDWDSTPGMIYQLQRMAGMDVWPNYGARRFASDVTDSVIATGGTHSIFRIIRIRQP